MVQWAVLRSTSEVYILLTFITRTVEEESGMKTKYLIDEGKELVACKNIGGNVFLPFIRLLFVICLRNLI